MRKSASEILKKVEERRAPVEFVEFDLFGEVEKYIEDFIEKNSEYCARVKAEGWLGERYRKGSRGLLGYLRTSFAIQICALKNLKTFVPVYSSNPDIVKFFRSDFIRNVALESQAVKPVYKKEHLIFLKNQK